ncbi:MAG TPA: HAD family hydrolase [Chromatiaceae bacterium]|jgi:HAD superfamily hydrolase (TIGR01490 family)|nr:HAD family hydrolase [Chromatiaceae bacterium]HIB84396.1 HAD family hydrolase [Chromatiaceae bacterium]HIN81670.1 HAD family hydrolase [Chromatiales bacterium]
MSLAIFDLDNTLLAGDSDYLWGQHLITLGVVDADLYERANDRFYKDYKQGQLDIMAFLKFALKPLSQHSTSTLQGWREDFLRERIRPIALPAAHALVDKHREAGDTLLIITATNRFITGPIAELFGIDNLIATDPEKIDGKYTGKITGTPCFQHGKVERLQHWLDQHQQSLDDSWFYSDSINDLALLEQVSHPVAVDPDERLRAHAITANWSVISLRE